MSNKTADELEQKVKEILRDNHGSLNDFEINLIRIGGGVTCILSVEPKSLLKKKDYDDINGTTLENGDVIKVDEEESNRVEFSNFEE